MFRINKSFNQLLHANCNFSPVLLRRLTIGEQILDIAGWRIEINLSFQTGFLSFQEILWSREIDNMVVTRCLVVHHQCPKKVILLLALVTKISFATLSLAI